MVTSNVVLMGEDYFAALAKELENLQKTTESVNNKMDSIKSDINQKLLEGFMTFVRSMEKNMKKSFMLDPPPTLFLNFKNYMDEWDVKTDFRFENVNKITLVDRSIDSSRNGDSITANYNSEGDGNFFRIVFSYCEGEHYYKYSGWKRVFIERKLYEAPIEKTNFDAIWDVLSQILKVWFESHLKRNRDILIQYLTQNFEKQSTYTA